MKSKKLPEPASAPPAVAEPEVDLAGACYRINILLPRSESSPGSRFYPAFQPIPPETYVDTQFAATLEKDRVDPDEAEPMEPTLVFQTGVSYSVDAHGRRYVHNVQRQTVEMMRAAQADELLREEEREKREAIEKEQWYEERQRREIELGQLHAKCLTEMLERERAAKAFLDEERERQEEQERSDAVPTISKGLQNDIQIK